jgi:hypothetical protein
MIEFLELFQNLQLYRFKQVDDLGFTSTTPHSGAANHTFLHPGAYLGELHGYGVFLLNFLELVCKR